MAHSQVPRLAWSVAEAAEAANVPTRQIYGAIQSGVLPAVRIGRHHRIPDAALRAWLAGGDARQTVAS